ncbi:MAG TPA: substrate-binding domain-containing protein [Acidimicrobiales bacterium]|nr:substrate-binding domain-containing protein [Acidimicrobiales bacterium]
MAALAGLVALSSVAAGCGGPPNAQASAPTGITVRSFTSSYAVMARFRALAAAGRGSVGVLLPDDGPLDPNAALDAASLRKAFRLAGLDTSQYRVDDAHGVAATQRAQASADIKAGASVLLLDAVDATTGMAVEQAAGRRGVRVVDYDRFTQGGSRAYFVGFDPTAIGTLMGRGALSCVSTWHIASPTVLELTRPLSDPSALELAQGYSAVLAPQFQAGAYTRVGEAVVPYGTPAAPVVQQALRATPGIDVVVAADDPVAGAVVQALRSSGVGPRAVAVVGQDASLPALRDVLAGYQCGSVYKPAYAEAQAGAALALYLRGELSPPGALADQVVRDSTTNFNVPAVVLTARWVTASDLAGTVVADHDVSVPALCAGASAPACARAGITHTGTG